VPNAAALLADLERQLDARFDGLCIAAGLDLKEARKDADIHQVFLEEDPVFCRLFTKWAELSGCLG
jgi:hypothetical protein